MVCTICMYCLTPARLGSENVLTVSFKHLILPERHPPNTPLLPLQPLPFSALNCAPYERLYTRFPYMNAIQTQFFHVLYYTDKNVLLGAPTGSGLHACMPACRLP